MSDISGGLLADYGLDLDDVEVPSFDIPDGTYEFSVGDVFIKEGSKANPEASWIIIEYIVGEDGKKTSEMFGLPADASNPTEDEKKTLGRYKGRVMSLGFPEEQVNSVTRENLVGIQGTFQLRTTHSAKTGRDYQNVRNLRLADDGSNEYRSDEAAPEAAAPKAATKAPAARRAPATRAETAVDNPFAKK